MTHKELLAKIEIHIADFCEDEKDFCDVCSPWKALRAVVNLHKPDGGLCNHCEEGFIMGSIPVVYPCLTIQAIVKELG